MAISERELIETLTEIKESLEQNTARAREIVAQLRRLPASETPPSAMLQQIEAALRKAAKDDLAARLVQQQITYFLEQGVATPSDVMDQICDLSEALGPLLEQCHEHASRLLAYQARLKAEA